jgi:hypothetical protein
MIWEFTKVDAEIKEKFKRQFWKKDQELQKDMIQELLKAYISREESKR